MNKKILLVGTALLLALCAGCAKAPEELPNFLQTEDNKLSITEVTQVVDKHSIAQLEAYPNLVKADLRGSTCYQAILDYAEAPVYPPPDNIMIFLNIYMAVNLVSLLILLIPRLYLHRLVPYKIMDSDEPCNGLQAVMYSRILMKGNRRKLFILDLSFGWFYLLEFAISAVAIGDLLMAALGISLPIGQEITGLLFPIAALLLRLLLHWWAKPKLMITYTLFYKTVLDESSKEPVPPQPKRRPWKY
jgi:hypothetical protein